MDLGLKGRVAIVAASSTGLGEASALELALEGASVVINGRDEDKLTKAAAEIRSATGAVVLTVAGDVTEEQHVASLIAHAKERFGRIDILVANAGGPPAGYFDDFAADDYRRAVELNLISTVNLCRAAVPHMRDNGWGRIVGITSIAAKQPVENLILSNTTRAAVSGFMKSLADQVASTGITVNTVCPGFHLTERLLNLTAKSAAKQGISTEEAIRRLAANIPANRIGDPKEFAAVVAFLCSERASYVTGTAIQVDGGVYRALY